MDLFPGERVQCFYAPRREYKVGMGCIEPSCNKHPIPLPASPLKGEELKKGRQSTHLDGVGN